MLSPFRYAPTAKTDLLQARAWTAAAAGDLPTARARLEEAADYGARGRRPRRCRQRAPRPGPPGPGPPGGRPLGGPRRKGRRRVRGGPRRLRQRGGGQRRPGSPSRSPKPSRDWAPLVYAAEASVEAAAVSRRDGHPREAAADEHRAAQLLSRCEGATTPVVRDDHGPVPPHPRRARRRRCRPPPVAPTSKSPLTVTSRCERSRTTSSASTKSSGSLAVASWPMHCVTSRAFEPALRLDWECEGVL